MKRPILFLFIALTTLGAFADDAPPPAPKLGDRADKLIQEALPVCSDKVTMQTSGLMHKLPVNLTGEIIRVDSKRAACAGQWVAITSRDGDLFLGIPWFLEEFKGTPEQKVKAFAWNALQQNMDAVMDKTPNRDGFFNITMYQTTERGKLPMQGEIDPEGNVIFIGHFFPMNVDYRQSRLKSLQSFIDNSPTTGATKAAVTVIEFSDFECPSCKAHSHDLQPILDKFGSQVRYIRYDLPLVTMHPWALAAAVAGRAVYRQKPDLFWEFKKQVYENQDKLSAFTIDDFTRGFAQDHELDMKKYDADVASDEIRNSLLAGAGAAFSNDVRATPTYMVNGTYVDPGDGGKFLESYVAGLLKK